MNTIISVRVNDRQKESAEINAKKLGTTLSAICRMIINYVAEKGEIPEQLLIPNIDTLQAIADMEKEKGVTYYNNINELKNDLGWK